MAAGPFPCGLTSKVNLSTTEEEPGTPYFLEAANELPIRLLYSVTTAIRLRNADPGKCFAAYVKHCCWIDSQMGARGR